MEKYLTHRGMDVWLVDPKGQIIPHTSDSVKDNTISATVSIKRGALYTINWKCSPNSPPLSAFWEAFVSSTPRSGRNKDDNQFPEGVAIASHFIDQRDPRSQALSSTKSRLFPPYKRNGHLEAPRSVLEDARLGFVRLELRRTQGVIAFSENPVPGQPGDHDCTIEADVVDDKNEGKAPYIVFQFNFIDASAAPSTPAKRIQAAEPSASSPKLASAKRRRVESPSAKSRQTSNTGNVLLPPKLKQIKSNSSSRNNRLGSPVDAASTATCAGVFFQENCYHIVYRNNRLGSRLDAAGTAIWTGVFFQSYKIKSLFRLFRCGTTSVSSTVTTKVRREIGGTKGTGKRNRRAGGLTEGGCIEGGQDSVPKEKTWDSLIKVFTVIWLECGVYNIRVSN
ncbi:uncharacterized protein LACBIDRAFT_315774 [Laccaria bicolor S238N-H82]|uniref:Predicted protein n=1 Tax=Laccaria bicolor (strain S238N-H82 / ATCC MYA-4686) TaxID=486041 RepID=B0D351_LACBS|nr:uncharacterized protein LACBIDRAFT_315774 [Laccaria bicolor S238N-H82]EDR10858.1 predicted protein [Laccaria bicolor S238N-H82]|eukprot:XP_001878159.1 predicted protein [Laccaria bicolor S238N-H82]